MDFDIKRTRFLADLDGMLMCDEKGAIADMLQVLRERKVIETSYSSVEVPIRMLERDGYREHIRKTMVANIGAVLQTEMRFSERTLDIDTIQMVCQIDVVRDRE